MALGIIFYFPALTPLEVNTNFYFSFVAGIKMPSSSRRKLNQVNNPNNNKVPSTTKRKNMSSQQNIKSKWRNLPRTPKSINFILLISVIVTFIILLPLILQFTIMHGVISADGAPACRISEFPCRNNHCVRLDRYCDGVDDCGDMSDEPRYCTGK